MEQDQPLQNEKPSTSQVRYDGIFRKSTMSGGGNCVEVAKYSNNIVKVRDSKDRNGATLVFTFEEWKAFLQGVHNNEFEIQ